MRTRSPSTTSIVGPGRLAVVAPQVRLHAGRHLAHHRLGDEVELLAAVVHAPGQRPAVERDHRVVGPAAAGQQRRHRVGLALRHRLGQRGQRDLADRRRRRRSQRRRRRGRFCRETMVDVLRFSAPALPASAAGRGRRGRRRLRLPISAMSRSASASQKSRCASIAALTLRDLRARVGQQFEHADQHAVVASSISSAIAALSGTISSRWWRAMS